MFAGGVWGIPGGVRAGAAGVFPWRLVAPCPRGCLLVPSGVPRRCLPGSHVSAAFDSPPTCPRAVPTPRAKTESIVKYAPRVLRQGSGEPLVLLHGVLCSERIWGNVVGLLSGQHDVIVPTMLGHNGGQLASRRPASVEHLVDDLERLLDELGLAKAHLAGNSLGGWVALELARRGRALSVCALSPAGAWGSETDGQLVRATLKRAVRDVQRSRRIVPLVAHSRHIRRFALRNSALHGERVRPAEFRSLTDDVLGCQISGDLFESDARQTSLDPAPCPITLAWSAADRIFPLEAYRSRACELVPGADFIVLDDVGHVPMLDDPRLVAQRILSSAARATGPL